MSLTSFAISFGLFQYLKSLLRCVHFSQVKGDLPCHCLVGNKNDYEIQLENESVSESQSSNLEGCDNLVNINQDFDFKNQRF